MNEFLLPTLSGIVATLVATGIIYGCGAAIKHVKEHPDRYTDQFARLAAALTVVVFVPALVGGGWLLHQMLLALMGWGAQVAASSAPGFADMPEDTRAALFGSSWPWHYTCAAFVLLAPVAVTDLIADRIKESEGLGFLRHAFARILLAGLALLVVAALAGLVIGAHVLIDAASAWAFATEPAYFPGLDQAWSLPWGRAWTTLAAAAAAAGIVQYYGFLAYLHLERTP
ncbi:hypothetical protein FZ103_10265 [Streptomonospora sp. PA3]|uniref:hypothetical protein n=1 Tax=Streptomonospora sp. PA3 TaxID=2607326 RepID=UPI0012DFD7BD|nr:hypothetical protein [Streptomonospora sp. PA3]MUL41555.1 hypothetical protein [Streptomonospora sp. PA3]